VALKKLLIVLHFSCYPLWNLIHYFTTSQPFIPSYLHQLTVCHVITVILVLSVIFCCTLQTNLQASERVVS